MPAPRGVATAMPFVPMDPNALRCPPPATPPPCCCCCCCCRDLPPPTAIGNAVDMPLPVAPCFGSAPRLELDCAKAEPPISIPAFALPLLLCCRLLLRVDERPTIASADRGRCIGCCCCCCRCCCARPARIARVGRVACCRSRSSCWARSDSEIDGDTVEAPAVAEIDGVDRVVPTACCCCWPWHCSSCCCRCSCSQRPACPACPPNRFNASVATSLEQPKRRIKFASRFESSSSEH